MKRLFFILCSLLIVSNAFAATKKINEFSTVSPMADADMFLIWDTSAGATKVVTKDVLMSSPGAIGDTASDTGKFTTVTGTTVVVSDNSDTLTLSHDGSSSHFKTSDGYFIFQTDEGTNKETYLDIKGKGTGTGQLRIYDEDDAEYLRMFSQSGYSYVYTTGAAENSLRLQHPGDADVEMFSSSSEGDTRNLKIYGFRTGDTMRTLEIGVGVDAADTASFDGVGTYDFDGTITAEIVEVSDNSDTFTFSHDGTNAYVKTSDGRFIFQTDEGTDTDTYVTLMGKGTGQGYIRVNDDDDFEYLNIYSVSGHGYIGVEGVTPQQLHLNHLAENDVRLFSAATEGETEELQIYGQRSGDSVRRLEIGISDAAADTASFDGLGTYNFDGKGTFADDLTVSGDATIQDDSGSTDLQVLGAGATDDARVLLADSGGYGWSIFNDDSESELQFWYQAGGSTEHMTLQSDGDLEITGVLTSAGLSLTNTITEFSTDGKMAGNSDSAVPTEQAVVEYVDRVDVSSYGVLPQVLIAGMTIANPVVVTATAHGFSDGDSVYINAVMTQLLDETNFFTHDEWDVTNDFVDSGGSGGNAHYTWSANQTSTLTQIIADRKSVGQIGKSYHLVYTIAGTTTPDGDFAMTLTTGFASAATTLPFTAGSHMVSFTSNDPAGDFVISAVSGTDTEGEFTIDNITLVCSDCTGVNSDSAYTVANKADDTFELSGTNGLTWDAYDDRSDYITGWVCEDHATALNSAVDAANASEQPLYLPVGTYRVNPGELHGIDCDVDGPQAVIGALKSTDDILMQIVGNRRNINLRSLVGYSATTVGPTCANINYSGSSVGTGLFIGEDGDIAYHNDIKIDYIAGFDEGIYISSEGTYRNCGSNTFTVDGIYYNDTGIKIVSGDSHPAENNRFYVNYSVGNSIHADLISGVALVVSNLIDWNVIELHTFEHLYGWPEHQVGIKLTGNETKNNEFRSNGFKTSPEAGTTELMPNQVDRDLSGASAWANVDLNAYDENVNLTITATAADQYCTLPVLSAPTTIYQCYILEFNVANIVSTWVVKDFAGTETLGVITTNGDDKTIKFYAPATGGLRLVAATSTSSGDFDNFSLVRMGTYVQRGGMSGYNLVDLPMGSTSYTTESNVDAKIDYDPLGDEENSVQYFDEKIGVLQTNPKYPRLLTYQYRRNAGTSWTGAGWRIQSAISGEYDEYGDGLSYIEFHNDAASTGVMYFGTSGSDQLRLRDDDLTLYCDLIAEGDFTITPLGDDVFIMGGLTVGSETQAGDNNLKIVGTSTLMGEVTVAANINANGHIIGDGGTDLVGVRWEQMLDPATEPLVLTAADSHTIIIITSTNGPTHVDLPANPTGLEFTFVDSGGRVTIDPDDTDYFFYHDGVNNLTAGETLVSSASRDTMTIIGISSSLWAVVSMMPTPTTWKGP